MSQTKNAKRFWKFAKQEKNKCLKARIQKRIKKAIKKKSGLTSTILSATLNCSRNFIGCYAEDEVDQLSFGSLPCFLIVNLDSSNMEGSHWIAIGIFQSYIEIFDSLGFDLFNWPRIPTRLLNFLCRLSITREVHVSNRFQSDSSTLCGLYAVFYIKYRPNFSFSFLENIFTSDYTLNDSFLIKSLLYMEVIFLI